MKAFIELQQLAASGVQRAELKELGAHASGPTRSRNAAATDYVTLLLSLFSMYIDIGWRNIQYDIHSDKIWSLFIQKISSAKYRFRLTYLAT
jgi:hypothetical protein